MIITLSRDSRWDETEFSDNLWMFWWNLIKILMFVEWMFLQKHKILAKRTCSLMIFPQMMNSGLKFIMEIWQFIRKHKMQFHRCALWKWNDQKNTTISLTIDFSLKENKHFNEALEYWKKKTWNGWMQVWERWWIFQLC